MESLPLRLLLSALLAAVAISAGIAPQLLPLVALLPALAAPTVAYWCRRSVVAARRYRPDYDRTTTRLIVT